MLIDYNILKDYQITEVTNKFILNLRSRLGMSMADFGQLFDVTHAQVYKWERALSSPPNATKIQMLQIDKKIKEQGAVKVSDNLKGILVVGGFTLVLLWLFNAFD